MTAIDRSKGSITHVRLRSPESAATVHARLIRTLPQLDPRLAEALRSGDADAVKTLRRDGPPLWLFVCRDMGSMLAVEGSTRVLYQYEIGNPLTAESMVRFQPAAGLYAPLRVVLHEENGGSVFAYDRPSDFFGQFGDERVRRIGDDLDRELETALSHALHATSGSGDDAA